MATIGIPPRTSDEWDVPATQVADKCTELQTARTRDGLIAEQVHQLDTCDASFAASACEHPEQCTTESGDPQWDAWLKARIADHRARWDDAHNTAGGAA